MILWHCIEQLIGEIGLTAALQISHRSLPTTPNAMPHRALIPFIAIVIIIVHPFAVVKFHE